MTAVAERSPAMSRRGMLPALARLEARRFARHPLFLAGAAVCAFATISVSNDATAGALAGDGVFPALLVGVVSMVVAYRLTRSTASSTEALDAVPTPATTRTAALCLACLVPAAIGLLWLLYMLFALRQWPPRPWMLGTFGPGDRVAILAGESVLPCLGAPLLGVAAGRWFRFPAGAPLLLIAVIGWASVGFAVATSSSGGVLSTALRLSSPFTFFATSGPGGRTLDNWTGSPLWYLLWLVALCALAAVAALLHGATDGSRTRLLRLGALCLALGLLAYALAVAGGLSRVVTIHPDGTRTTAASTVR